MTNEEEARQRAIDRDELERLDRLEAEGRRKKAREATGEQALQVDAEHLSEVDRARIRDDPDKLVRQLAQGAADREETRRLTEDKRYPWMEPPLMRRDGDNHPPDATWRPPRPSQERPQHSKPAPIDLGPAVERRLGDPEPESAMGSKPTLPAWPPDPIGQVEKRIRRQDPKKRKPAAKPERQSEGANVSLGAGAAAISAARTFTDNEVGGSIQLSRERAEALVQAILLIKRSAEDAVTQFLAAWGDLESGHLNQILQQFSGIQEKADEMLRGVVLVETKLDEVLGALSTIEALSTEYMSTLRQ